MEHQLQHFSVDKNDQQLALDEVNSDKKPTDTWTNEYLADESCYVLGYN